MDALFFFSSSFFASAWFLAAFVQTLNPAIDWPARLRRRVRAKALTHRTVFYPGASRPRPILAVPLPWRRGADSAKPSQVPTTAQRANQPRPQLSHACQPFAPTFLPQTHVHLDSPPSIRREQTVQRQHLLAISILQSRPSLLVSFLCHLPKKAVETLLGCRLDRRLSRTVTVVSKKVSIPSNLRRVNPFKLLTFAQSCSRLSRAN